MTFRVPAFPLTINVWQAQGGQIPPPSGKPTAVLRAQLRLLKAAYLVSLAAAGGSPIMVLYLPKFSDVRPPHANGVRGDAVEVPASSGRFYSVLAVDDVAKGFPNEYRFAAVQYNPNRSGWWPFPTP